MDSDAILPARFVKCHNCGSSCSLSTASLDTWVRSVKRKYDELETGNRFYIPGLDMYANAKVEIENECVALRETLTSQQQAIKDLYEELEEERNAASSAANEAMSMILRLQREKAEIEMEARQFKRFAEEKMAHDQQEILALEDLLYKREQTIHSITCEIQAYKHRMLSYGFCEAEIEDGEDGFGRNPSIVDIEALYELPPGDYPPLRCDLNGNPGYVEGDVEVGDVENYLDVGSPQARGHLKNLEHRISLMEKNPGYTQLDEDISGGDVLEKVVVNQSPRKPGHQQKASADISSPQVINKEAKPYFSKDSPGSNGSFKKADVISPRKSRSQAKNVDNASEERDDMSDRVYTIDFVHDGSQTDGAEASKAKADAANDYVTSPREPLRWPDADPDIKKLYIRLQALEADRESMRQAILSMQTDKAQLMLMKEIAQHFSKEMGPRKRMPVRKASVPGAFSFISIFKWILSLVFWKKTARQSRYLYGLPPDKAGLLMLLDKGSHRRQWRCLTSSQIWNHH